MADTIGGDFTRLAPFDPDARLIGAAKGPSAAGKDRILLARDLMGILMPGPYKSGNWYQGFPQNNGTNSGASIGKLRFVPFYIPNPVTISQLALVVTTGVATAVAALGIYSNDIGSGEAKPGALLGNTGSIDTSVTAATTLVPAALSGGNLALDVGHYWYAENAGVAVSTLWAPSQSASIGDMFLGSANGNSIAGATGRVGWELTTAFGTWPADITVLAPVETTSGGAMPYFKVA